MRADIKNIVRHFRVPGELVGFSECKTGHINSTFFVTFRTAGAETKYVLQKINTYVFKDPERLMSNIVGVTEYLRRVIEKEGGDPERGTLRFIPCDDGQHFCRDSNGGCWRMYKLIDDVLTYQLAESTELFREVGFAFGDFQRKLAGYDTSTLHETIPDFHNTKKRYSTFERVVTECTSERRIIAAAEIDFIRERRDKCSYIVDEIAAGRLPVRVTHNDTKLNNILIDKTTGRAVCIIDLDTVMPGSALYDFGDSIRFGASSALEDEADLDKVYFRADMYEAFAEGFIKGAGGALTEREISLLPMGAYIITLETGMRFLTDYLEGDVYFRTEYEGHNLTRARNQLKLVYDFETRFDEFRSITEEFM
ncbi:MAG TPA: aminoglycoside phosphotransferase family protein [Clostridiales bacterium]|jgi:hypothetical protein|nr:aminoglycoside phosphotransferase family protein [Clostridiales bacterium]